jgi:hypothetical protein
MPVQLCRHVRDQHWAEMPVQHGRHVRDQHWAEMPAQLYRLFARYSIRLFARYSIRLFAHGPILRSSFRKLKQRGCGFDVYATQRNIKRRL